MKALFPGTFDPITKGHLALIGRASHLFEEIIVAIADTRKSTLFSLEERLSFVKGACANFESVRVESFSGLVVDFAKQLKANYLLRGLRSSSDFNYEFHLAAMNRKLDSEIETIFLPAWPEQAYISATLVREIIQLKGDITPFVPAVVCDYMKR